MSLPRLLRSVALVLCLGAVGCGDRADGASAEMADAEVTDDDGLPAEPAPPTVDPCRLLTDEEVSEQLWLAIPTHQREHYKTKGFDITKTEVPWGISRRCEIHFGTKETVSGGPVWRGDFNVMVSHAASYVADRRKQPIPGVGDEAYQHERVFYVRVGDYTATLTDFDGTSEPGLEPDAGRIALLRHMAQRLR